MARMELPVLDKFCFIFDLKTGCLVMGAINSLLTFILSMVLITLATEMGAAGTAAGAAAGAAATGRRTPEDADGSMGSVVYTIVVLLAVLLLVKFLFDIVFVYAVYKERSSIMKKYCIFWMVFLVLSIIGFLKTLFHMSAGLVITQILFLAENFYFMVIIRSYLISINEDGVL